MSPGAVSACNCNRLLLFGFEDVVADGEEIGVGLDGGAADFASASIVSIGLATLSAAISSSL